MNLIGHHTTSALTNTQVPIVASNDGCYGFTNLYNQTIQDVQAGDLLVMRSTVQYSGLGRNFPIFVAGRISVCKYSGDYGGNESPAHGVDVCATDHNPYAIMTHLGSWVADQNYSVVWPLVWGWARSAGNEGNTVDVLNQGRLEVFHYRPTTGFDHSAAIAALQAENATQAIALASLGARLTALENAPPPSTPAVISVPPEGLTVQFVQAA